VTEPAPVFSACYGAPFMPLHPQRYAELLGKKMREYSVRAWLINTGWTGGPYGEGERMSIAHTRAIVNAVLDGQLNGVATQTDPVFGVRVPLECPGVPAEILNPRNTWKKQKKYDRQAQQLAAEFNKNFEKFADGVSAEILAAAPKAG
jgi:phosphoenolpyruvate carboxykinase (ATP)